MKITFESELEKQTFMEELEYLQDFVAVINIDKYFLEHIKLDENKIKNLLNIKNIIIKNSENT